MKDIVVIEYYQLNPEKFALTSSPLQYVKSHWMQHTLMVLNLHYSLHWYWLHWQPEP